MSCQSNIVPGSQSEFEFFQDLMQHQAVITKCCGPITYLGLNPDGLRYFKGALKSAGFDVEHLDLFVKEVIDSNPSYTVLGMCPRHWFTHIAVVGRHGVEQNNPTWQSFSMGLFELMCATNKWDHKELTNFLKTYTEARKRNDS